MSLFDRILAARGIDSASRAAFLNPNYSAGYDPFVLPDMDKAVRRLQTALKKQEKITIYGDYDIDGLTAATLIVNALENFGFKNVDVFIPNRFVEGYGLASSAITDIAKTGTKLIISVDCGSQSYAEADKAKELGIDLIVTDHHEIDEKLPKALAVVNPKRSDSEYPFKDLAGVGVAFKLVQALQTKLTGLSVGQEKWLLDLVALGTVCDVVNLTNENRLLVYYGLKTLAKTRRPGLKALMAISRINPNDLNTQALGFGLGPRINASGRLETAKYALEMLMEKDPLIALKKAELLESMNKTRRIEQDKIFKEAVEQANLYENGSVLVVNHKNWNHGIVGIVASKLLELFKKPVFIFQEMGTESKGSARSYGGFSIVKAIKDSKDVITKGGGHKMAGGVALPTDNIERFRKSVNKSYVDQGLVLSEQQKLLLPIADTDTDLNEVTEDVINQIKLLEPFGIGNPQPILRISELCVKNIRKMGSDNQHIKFELQNKENKSMCFVGFNMAGHYSVNIGDVVSVWFSPTVNEWQGQRTIEGRLLHLE